MIHASKLFPIAMDRIHDQIKRGKRKGRKASVRGANRVKRKEKRARQALIQFN